MVIIQNTDFPSNMSLASVYSVLTKEEMMEISKKLDLDVSPNLSKDETAVTLAREVLEYPISVLSRLCKSELALLDEFYEAGPNAYITKKIRKIPYKLQKFSLVLTYEDLDKDVWCMIMPDSVRLSISPYATRFIEMLDTEYVPTDKSIRLMDALDILGVNKGKNIDEEFSL